MHGHSGGIHLPVLILKSDSVDPRAVKLPSFSLVNVASNQKGNVANEFEAWILADSEVSFSPAGRPVGRVTIPSNLLNMKTDLCVTHDCAVIDPSRSVGNGLVFDVRVPPAGAETTWLDPGLNRVVFRSKVDKELGAIAEEVCLQFEIPGDTLTMHVKRQNTEFDVPVKAQDGRIDIMAVHRPLPQPKPGDVLEHIDHFYGLSKSVAPEDHAYVINQKGPQLPRIRRHNHPEILSTLIPSGSDCPPGGGWEP
ncbi:MAG: hypothetical protein ABR517_03730, partial [Thermoanaerobaculia bacterium]